MSAVKGVLVFIKKPLNYQGSHWQWCKNDTCHHKGHERMIVKIGENRVQEPSYTSTHEKCGDHLAPVKTEHKKAFLQHFAS